jgi:dihydroorotate dehydrogenase (NAD+) catalytic subunit
MGLKTRLAGTKMRNPLVLASGILGISYSLLKRVQDNGAGAVTTKSIGPEEKAGHENPTVLPWECGIINAVGLSCEGYRNMEDGLKEMKRLKVPLIMSIYGSAKEEFAEVASFLKGYRPAIFELNISCPNSEKHGQIFGFEPETAAAVVSAVKDEAGKIPVMPKLTPNTHRITEVAKACEEAGADAIAAINTVQGMLINIEARKPLLHFTKGGLSGPAVRPIAVRCVYDIYKAVEIPILGLGGITTGRDALEMMEAGAAAVGVGSAVYYRGVEAFSLIAGEMESWMKENGVSKVTELTGAAHG